MESMISELFHGGLKPNEKSYRHKAYIEMLLDSFERERVSVIGHIAAMLSPRAFCAKVTP